LYGLLGIVAHDAYASAEPEARSERREAIIIGNRASDGADFCGDQLIVGLPHIYTRALRGQAQNFERVIRVGRADEAHKRARHVR
jgi:hypothetical protein